VKATHVLISGRVQGVFFRQTAATMARRSGVVGWIRNLPGGDVEAVFQGEDEAVDAMVEWCRQGPPYATIDDVRITGQEIGNDEDFRIK
jgi:acylphosphatase